MYSHTFRFGQYVRLIVAISLVVVPFQLFSQSQDELELSLAYGSEEFISIATGNEQPLNLAPSVASVITARQIKQMGATDLDEILETVPGLHVSRTAIAYSPLYQIRGIATPFNPQVLLLINGIPATSVYIGDRGQLWGGMPVQAIDRVEVIRGPGSAIYGADAFAGVINVITKTGKLIDGIEMGVRGGTFDRRDAWLLAGKQWHDWEVAFSFEAGKTEGQDERVEMDAQNSFDALFSSNASLAPGSVSTGRNFIESRLDIAVSDWRLRAGYQGRYDIGSGAGVAQALDPVGRGKSKRWTADLTYTNTKLVPDLELTAQLSYFHLADRTDATLFPPGATFPDSSNVLRTFSDGVIGRPDRNERHYRIDLGGLFTGITSHQVKIGAGFRLEDLYQVNETKNFTQTMGPFPTPLPNGLTNVSDTNPFVQESDRKVWYGFVQDQWNFLPDWTLTAGVRYDHYSDFGDTVNPRFAVVWQTTYKLTSKILYGRAFRAPSFAEQFNINNPVLQGNSDLDPETIDSVELAFDYQPTNSVRTKLNLFWYRFDKIIRFGDPSGSGGFERVADNSGDQTGYGLEFEAGWDVAEDIRIIGNYAFQQTRDNQDNGVVGFAPNHQIYVRGDWQFFPGWNLDIQTNWVGERLRGPNDPRSEVDDYVTVDLTLRGKILGDDHWELALSARNLFDEDAREPSLPNDGAPNGSFIPEDLPLSGQSIFFEVRFNY